MIPSPTWPDVEQAVLSQRAALDRDCALYRELNSDMTLTAPGSADGRSHTGRLLKAAREALGRAESLLETWRRALADVERLLAGPRQSKSLDRAFVLLYGDGAVELAASALRREDRRPPGARPETRYSLAFVMENTENDLRAAQQAVARIAEGRDTAARLKALLGGIDETAAAARAALGGGDPWGPAKARARLAELVGLASADPLGLPSVDAAALEAELAGVRREQLSILIDRLEAEENELRSWLTARACRGIVVDRPLVPRAAIGLRGRLRGLEPPYAGRRHPDPESLPAGFAAIEREIARALSVVRSERERARPAVCVRPGCAGDGVIEEDGTCSVCFLPPAKAAT